MRVNSLAFRLMIGALMWCGVSFLIGGLVLASLFKGAVERALDDRLGVVADNLLAVVQVNDMGTLSLTRPLADSRFERAFPAGTGRSMLCRPRMS